MKEVNTKNAFVNTFDTSLNWKILAFFYTQPKKRTFSLNKIQTCVNADYRLVKERLFRLIKLGLVIMQKEQVYGKDVTTYRINFDDPLSPSIEHILLELAKRKKEGEANEQPVDANGGHSDRSERQSSLESKMSEGTLPPVKQRRNAHKVQSKNVAAKQEV